MAPATRSKGAAVVKKSENGTKTKPEKTKVSISGQKATDVTNWDTINFRFTSKTPTGKSSNFRIISWNVDGIRTWKRNGGIKILDYANPDILCLQDTKCSQSKIPKELNAITGYESIWYNSLKERYGGVGILTKVKPIRVIEGFNKADEDKEGRCLSAEFEKFYLINVYVPRAGDMFTRQPPCLNWNASFKTFVKDLDKEKPVIVCGNMNVAQTDIDFASPKPNNNNSRFITEAEDDHVDTFRKLHPDREKAFTFWAHMATTKKLEWRPDYFIVSERFMDNVGNEVIPHSEVFVSSHCPMSLYINF